MATAIVFRSAPWRKAEANFVWQNPLFSAVPNRQKMRISAAFLLRFANGHPGNSVLSAFIP